jgi:hypothetical protein
VRTYFHLMLSQESRWAAELILQFRGEWHVLQL